MTRFNARAPLPVAEPFRFDLTVDALRRLAANVVDVVDERGLYTRALAVDGRVVPLRVEAIDGVTYVSTARQADLAFCVETATRMLGSTVELSAWYERTQRVPWLAPLAQALRGLKPPRYPTLFEACAHAIVFQQISIHAAAAIMRRFVTSCHAEPVEAPCHAEPVKASCHAEPVEASCHAEPVEASCHAELVEALPFPTPEIVVAADVDLLRGCGLSLPKVSHLKSAAAAILSGELQASVIDALPTPDAAAYLTGVRGIGPWSAAVVLLRGFGRLDTFPLKDSGVARSLKLLSGDPNIDVDAVLNELGNVRGMLYYHLLLGRLRNLLPGTYSP